MSKNKARSVNQKEVLEAAARIRDRVPEARFLVLGGGHLLKGLRRRAAGLGIESTLEFPGYAPRHLVPYYTAAADVAVACFEDNRITRSGLTSGR